jgi:flagellar biogenesis protein FliO
MDGRSVNILRQWARAAWIVGLGCLIFPVVALGNEATSSPVATAALTSQSQPASAESEGSAGESPALRLADDNRAGAASSEKPASPVWQTLSSVLVVLALGILAMLALKRFGPRMGLPAAGGKGKRVKMLETTYLGQRKAVHLVQVGSKKFLLAGSQSGLTLLAEVTDAFEDGQEGKG